MKKKGFTLIELLAVIVILAIIALIATPIILSMINNARKSAAKSSAYGYIEAIDSNNGFADAEVEGYTKIEDGTYDTSEISVRMKGKAPEGGEVTITSGKVTSADICMNGYNVEYDGHEAEVKNKCVPIKNITVDNFNSNDITWEDIRNAYQKDPENLRAVFTAGTTKNVTLTDYGTHPVRIANLTPCNDPNRPATATSTTSCGLVLEFADVITTARLTPGDSTTGGYPGSEFYATYIASNATNPMINKFPSDLRDLIINTTVVSSHNSAESSNYTTVDKIYLLSTKEVGFNNTSQDSVQAETVRLDYYATRSAKKTNGGSNINVYLRTFQSNSSTDCRHVDINGGSYSSRCKWSNFGISPAFRLSN